MASTASILPRATVLCLCVYTSIAHSALSPSAALLQRVSHLPEPFSSWPSHPRLILTPSRLSAMQSFISNDSDASTLYSNLLSHGSFILPEPPMPQPIPGPSGVLIQVRTVLDRIMTLSLLSLLDADNSSVWRDRAVLEARYMCLNWSDWNYVQHTLDTGEMSTAIAFAYDWMYASLSEDDRSVMEAGLMNKSMTPFRSAFTTRPSWAWWVNNTINWNCVCAGGAIMGALAIADVAPAWVVTDVLNIATATIIPCAGSYSTDGSWCEGPAYWGYATKYLALTIASLDTAAGGSYGIAATPGINISGLFPLQMQGPTLMSWDWADSGTGESFYPYGMWYAGEYGAADEMATAFVGRVGALEIASTSINSNGTWGAITEGLMYFTPSGSSADVYALPVNHVYDSRKLVTFRSSWGDIQASFLGFKGGDNAWNHNHLDLGSWVYETGGQRWAHDLGADNYALPGYFGAQRWDYYRLNVRGHNTLLVGNNNVSQAITATADLLFVNTTTGSARAPAIAWGVVDLSIAYAGVGFTSALRGFAAYTDGGNASRFGALIVDEFMAPASAANVTWQMHTYATVVVAGDGQSVTLTREGQTATLAILPASSGTACPGVTFTATPIDLLPPQNPTTGLTRVDAVLLQPTTCTRLAITIGANVDTSMVVNPLGSWQAAGPFAA